MFKIIITIILAWHKEIVRQFTDELDLSTARQNRLHAVELLRIVLRLRICNDNNHTFKRHSTSWDIIQIHLQPPVLHHVEVSNSVKAFLQRVASSQQLVTVDVVAEIIRADVRKSDATEDVKDMLLSFIDRIVQPGQACLVELFLPLEVDLIVIDQFDQFISWQKEELLFATQYVKLGIDQLLGVNCEVVALVGLCKEVDTYAVGHTDVFDHELRTAVLEREDLEEIGCRKDILDIVRRQRDLAGVDVVDEQLERLSIHFLDVDLLLLPFHHSTHEHRHEICTGYSKNVLVTIDLSVTRTESHVDEMLLPVQGLETSVQRCCSC